MVIAQLTETARKSSDQQWIPTALRAFAVRCRARALYVVSEEWLSAPTPERPNGRRRAVVIDAENPSATLPQRTYAAFWSTADVGLESWFEPPYTGRYSGRLPPDAYGKKTSVS